MATLNLRIARDDATLRQKVEKTLRSAIHSGHFKPGQRLIERELCELIGVGRTSIREALRQMEAEGLVTTIPYRGPSVASISAEGARDLYQLLGVLKPFAARLFAERGSPADIEALVSACGAVRQAVGIGPEAYLEARTNFHACVTRGCRNEPLQQALAGLNSKIQLLSLPSILQPGRMEQSVVEFEAICAAIAAGNSVEAEAATRRHMEAAAEASLAVLNAAGEEISVAE